MSKSITAKNAGKVQEVQKDFEYKKFIELVGGAKQLPEHWELLANAIGVHRNTIARWKKQPEFEQARIKGINRRLKAMEDSGKDDWRQWEASLKLLGVKTSDQPTTNIQVNITPILGGSTVQSNNSNAQVIEATEAD